MLTIFEAKNEIRIIGTRHGEKLYESLVSREEMARAEDMDGFYRIPADDRDLNYSKFFTSGETAISAADDYTSHNTQRMNQKQVIDLLLKLDYIQDALKPASRARAAS